MTEQIIAAFVPLVDCAVLVAARERDSQPWPGSIASSRALTLSPRSAPICIAQAGR